MKNLQRISTKFADTELGEKSRTWHYIFKDKLADFEAFDPDLNAAFAQQWVELIEEFEGHQSDENTLDELQQYTVDLEKAIAQMMSVVHSLEYFIDEIFRDEPYRKKETGIIEAQRLRYKSASALVYACRTLVAKANNLLPQLQAAGMPPTLMPQLEAAIANTDQRLMDQNSFKLTRTELTHQRIKIINRLFLTHRLVARAAQSVYYNNPIIIKQFE